MRSFSRQLVHRQVVLAGDVHDQQSVCWALSPGRGHVHQTSFQIQVAGVASFFPRIVSGTSAQPVKRFLAFHSLAVSYEADLARTLFQAILTVLRLVVDGRVGAWAAKRMLWSQERAARSAMLLWSAARLMQAAESYANASFSSSGGVVKTAPAQR